jgi:hypothetical protein
LHGQRRKLSLSTLIATEVDRLLLAYSLRRECVYRVVAWQRTSILTLLFRLPCVVSQYYLPSEWCEEQHERLRKKITWIRTTRNTTLAFPGFPFLCSSNHASRPTH